MKHFDQRIAEDLEFDTVREILAAYAYQPTAAERLAGLEPIDRFHDIEYHLQITKEFLRIRTDGETFPRTEFEELKAEIRILEIKNSRLTEAGFARIKNASLIANDVLAFFKGRKELYPLLTQLVSQVYSTKDLIKAIDRVFDQRGNIRDDASPELSEIRKHIRALRTKINTNFERELRKMRAAGMLSETKESFINDRRVLSIESAYKRKIEGNVLGSSKTGAVTYIEPKANIQFNQELDMRYDEERREIFRILKLLTDEMRGFFGLIVGYQNILTELDFIQAKVRFAIQIEADLPQITKDTHIELVNAYHPILLINNRSKNLPTLPQTLKMDRKSRMLVISGPNAGGKSITLKTVGLLQVMLQSGLMIPADSESKMSFFQVVLTDIGDNQSIENQLSTYSYRLKRMKEFLEKANRRTLLLLDEFGTGSDPELGGALAEVFFEELYAKKSFAVITTHYSNIKLKADSLPQAINGCMLFDRNSLAPLYKLNTGQPGSSFTFEVAQINGIPMDLIERAKTYLSEGTVRMDKLLSSLQKDKSRIGQLRKSMEDAEREARIAKREAEAVIAKYKQRRESQQRLIEDNNDFLNKGKKLDQFIRDYTQPGKVKSTLAEVKKYLAMEKTKLEEERKKKKMLKNQKQSKKRSTPAKPKENRNTDKIKLGSTVKLKDSKQKGEVIAMDGKEVTVTFGVFKTKVDISKLVWVK